MIKVASGSPTYLVKDNDGNNNGCSDDNYFGRIQLQNSASVTLDFELRGSVSGALVELPRFNLVFFDIDQDSGPEWVSSSGMNNFELSDSTSITAHTTPINPTFKTGSTNNIATPTDPDLTQMGSAQRNVALNAHYVSKSAWQVTLMIGSGPSSRPPTDGGAFYFGGSGILAQSCPTTTPSNSPSNAPSNAPTTSPSNALTPDSPCEVCTATSTGTKSGGLFLSRKPVAFNADGTL